MFYVIRVSIVKMSLHGNRNPNEDTFLLASTFPVIPEASKIANSDLRKSSQDMLRTERSFHFQVVAQRSWGSKNWCHAHSLGPVRLSIASLCSQWRTATFCHPAVLRKLLGLLTSDLSMGKNFWNRLIT